MADTARNILQDALEFIKVAAPGVPLDAADGARGLRTMNQLLDEWSNEPYACIANVSQSFPLVVGKSQYTIGAGGDVNTTRPLEILEGPGTAYLKDSNSMQYPVEVVQQQKWNAIPLLTITSDLPDTLFYDPQFPLGLINIYPVPSVGNTLYFLARLQLSDMATLDTAFSLPPGYMSALYMNVGIRLWHFYKQGDPTPKMIEDANKALAAIKRTNMKTLTSIYDGAIVSKATSGYNIYNDSPGRSGNS